MKKNPTIQIRSPIGSHLIPYPGSQTVLHSPLRLRVVKKRANIRRMCIIPVSIVIERDLSFSIPTSNLSPLKSVIWREFERKQWVNRERITNLRRFRCARQIGRPAAKSWRLYEKHTNRTGGISPDEAVSIHFPAEIE